MDGVHDERVGLALVVEDQRRDHEAPNVLPRPKPCGTPFEDTRREEIEGPLDARSKRKCGFKISIDEATHRCGELIERSRCENDRERHRGSARRAAIIASSRRNASAFGIDSPRAC